MGRMTVVCVVVLCAVSFAGCSESGVGDGQPIDVALQAKPNPAFSGGSTLVVTITGLAKSKATRIAAAEPACCEEITVTSTDGGKVELTRTTGVAGTYQYTVYQNIGSQEVKLGTLAVPVLSCGNARCDSGENCASCASDCGACPAGCGDGTCNGSETCTSCAADCGACPASCGDGTCNGSETCTSCLADCGACPASCGDGTCNGSETCTSCAADCGACPSGPVYYFSDCQPGAASGCVPGSNANPGTSATAPKRNLTGFDVNALPAGTSLLFARGGSWIVGTTTFENMNSSAAAPITLDACGSGPAPLLTTSNNAVAPFELGGNYGNTSDDGGYVFRNLRLDGSNNSAWGFWLSGSVRDVVIENVEISGFQIAIHSQARAPHGVNDVLIRNNTISRNGSMGILGQFRDSVIEGNLFEANNFSGSGFNHGTYLSGSDGLSGTNVTLRNNRYIRNSVVNGVCRGGNMTFHGQMDGVLIEGNRVEQDAAADGCWEMSITQGYSTAEWFRNFVVRNNKLINAGNTAMAVQSAPGIVIEGNVIINTQTTYQTGINVGHNEYQNGDVPDGNAMVRNNTACYPTPNAGSIVVRVTAPGSQVTNNVMVTGADATTGVCAR